MRAALSGILIAISLIPVLVAIGLGAHPAVAPHSASTVARIAFPPAALRPLIQRFVPVFSVVCVAITFLSMWARARPRRREIGVLRFLGASKTFVIAVVFAEAAAIGLGGAVLAIVISQSMLSCLNVLTAAAPPYSIGLGWCLSTSCMAVSAGIAGSTIPCAVSLRQDVLDMLERDA
jgi:putative ABC transport system permease protein